MGGGNIKGSWSEEWKWVRCGERRVGWGKNGWWCINIYLLLHLHLMTLIKTIKFWMVFIKRLTAANSSIIYSIFQSFYCSHKNLNFQSSLPRPIYNKQIDQTLIKTISKIIMFTNKISHLSSTLKLYNYTKRTCKSRF